MARKIYGVLFCLSLLLQLSFQSSDFDDDFEEDDPRMIRNSRIQRAPELSCTKVRPFKSDIVKRLFAILPYFDKDHANSAFLHKLRGTIFSMSESSDILDQEAGFFATVMTPVIFLQNYRDSWCLLERFHRAIRFYQISHPTDKRASLKILQNLRGVNQKIRNFIDNLHGTWPPTRTTARLDFDDEDVDKKDIKYLKELIKNLG